MLARTSDVVGGKFRFTNARWCCRPKLPPLIYTSSYQRSRRRQRSQLRRGRGPWLVREKQPGLNEKLAGPPLDTCNRGEMGCRWGREQGPPQPSNQLQEALQCETGSPNGRGRSDLRWENGRLASWRGDGTATDSRTLGHKPVSQQLTTVYSQRHRQRLQQQHQQVQQQFYSNGYNSRSTNRSSSDSSCDNSSKYASPSQ